ncbi:cysteine--tRNA ligase [Lapidilactobacillus wuchangensis]|uniref:cysteine--tRNA ligase n=1 Tax=Lapidilactobacillus wuchangensis TaxID=2486001 RepID=UPI000F77A895|nr:cysteine--tRNA ligase [Lapidilactobacillus wuchangensis]
MLKVFNTLTREKETFKSIEPGKVRMYVCGPTVYNYIHIGNARSAVAFDTIRRYLEFSGYQVDYISNFTDIGEKLARTATAENTTVAAVAAKYIAAVNEDSAALNIEPATYHPRATENIKEIIALVTDLVAQGMAYEVDGDVYFRAKKFPEYGKLSHQPLSELEVGASQRTNSEETARKEDPIDFALWKAAKPGEVFWESPWGPGSPGWHVECSVMAIKYLGKTIDIHGGGEDLAFPHHENEIAQSETFTGQRFANYWLHNGFVTVGTDDEKMSKSLGNFVTAHEALSQFNPQAIRFFMAATHYRRPLRYTEAGLDDALSEIQRFKIARANLLYRRKDATAGNDDAIDGQRRLFVDQFKDAFDDDFNVQNGLAVIHEYVRFMNKYAVNPNVKLDTLMALVAQLDQFVGIYGVDLGQTVGLDAEVADLIVKRNAARAAKDYQTSDEIRDQLTAAGIILEDTAQGTRWRRK